MAARCGKKLGISLPFTGLAWLRHYYQQTRSAIEYGMLYRPGSTVFEFYDYAVLWLLESSAGTDCRQLCACNPDAVRMAEAHYLENEENQLDTLYMYLKNECSPQKTSQEMYVHKNTLLYRLKKIMGSLEYPLQDKYDRDYMYLSITLISFYEKRYKKLLENFYKKI